MRLLHVIQNADMRCKQPGLLRIAESIGVPMDQIRAGDILAFLNRKQDKLVLLSFMENHPTPVLGYYVSDTGRIAPEAIQFIPEAFGSNGFKLQGAIQKGLEALLGDKYSDGEAHSRLPSAIRIFDPATGGERKQRRKRSG